MSENTRFYGKGTNFGIGVVEDVNDPLKSGRVRVRIYGIHSPFTDELPTSDLPWSQVMLPTTSASISGEGDTPQLQPGSQVFGVFMDGDTFQQFFVVGSMVGFSGRTVVQRDLDPPIPDAQGKEPQARLVGGTNAEQAFHFFIQYGGYTEDQSAGIVGVLENESSGLNSIRPKGLIGWEGDRLASLKEFAANSNLEFTNLGIQLVFILAELQGSYVHVSKNLVNTQQPSTAAEIFSKGYLNKEASSTTKTYANNAKAAFGTTGGSATGPFSASEINRAEYAEGEIVESSEELLNIFKSAKKKRSITELIVHDTATYNDEQVTVADISKKHAAQGFNGVQYHFLIQRNGTLQIGRDVALRETLISNTIVDENVTTVDEEGKQFIRDKEGFIASAQPDGNGFSIGYGHNNLTAPITAEDDGPITVATAEEYLSNDLAVVEAAIISALNGVPINQNEMNAYASLAYNIGISAFTASTTLRLFKQGKKAEAADAILLFKFFTEDGVKKFSSGLQDRRNAERNVFLKSTSSAQRKTVSRSDTSISIALAGGKKGSSAQISSKDDRNFQAEQMKTFDWFVRHFISIWPDSNLLGHRDLDKLSTDPQFDVGEYVLSKFDHQNAKDAPNNPIIPNDQVKIPSTAIDNSIIEDQISIDSPVKLGEASPDEDVTIIEATGTSTVTNPGFNFNLTPYLLISNFPTLLAKQSIFKLNDVQNVSYTNGQVLAFNTSTNRFEPADNAGGGLYSISDTIANITSSDYLSFIDVNDSNNPKRILPSTFISDLSIATASSTTSFINKSGNISQWTNDSGYITSTLTNEEVQDIVGAMFSGNSETLVTVTYQDVDGTIDVVVDNNLANYDNSTSLFISDIVQDTSPELGGNLNVAGFKITSITNGNIDIEPNGTGNILLGNFTFDADQTVGVGQDNYVLTYDNATGLISLEAAAGGGGGDVTKVGTPSNNQVGVWTGDGTIEGDSNFVWDGTSLRLEGAAAFSWSKMTISGANSSTTNAASFAMHSDADTSNPFFHILGFNSDNIQMVFGGYYNAGHKSGDAGSNFIIGKVSDELKFYADTGITAGSAFTPNEIMSLEPDGNLNITGVLRIQDGAVTEPVIGSSSIGVFQRTSSTIVHIIGGTSDVCSLSFGDSDDADAGQVRYRNNTDDMLIYTAGAAQFEFDSDGDFIAEGNVTANGTASDIRWKENIEYGIPNATEKLMSLDAITFNYIGKDERLMGVIAQQVEKVAPELIWEGDIKPGAKEGETRKQMRYGNFTALLLQALKDMKQNQDKLEKRIKELEGNG